MTPAPHASSGDDQKLKVDPATIRDHFLPPDRDEFVGARARKGRIIVIAPTRAACETIERALATELETTLQKEHGSEIGELARSGKGFGIVAGTGTGKTLAIRPIALEILGEALRVGVVNREREATPETPTWNVVIVTTGIARRWFQDELVSDRDTLVIDEIHQTSAELELCLALGKRAGCRFVWLSATVDPAFYSRYLNAAAVIHSAVFDPARSATVRTHHKTPIGFIQSSFIRRVVEQKRGVAVFLPTRAEVEQLAAEIGDSWGELEAAFYHGGEPIRVIRPFLDGQVRKPFLLAMTAAGQSAINVPGLDTVVINDARFTVRIEGGRKVLTRKPLGANEILQMAGRVHGRVEGGEVDILTERELRFEDLKPVPPEFQLAGDSERVALTAAAIGVDLEDLDLPVPLDRRAYRRAVGELGSRGIIEGGRLTEYGKAVEAMPVDRPWAELLVNCERDVLPFVAVAANVDSLHRMTRDDPDLRGLVVSGSDHLTAYNVYAEAVNAYGSLGQVYGLARHQFAEAMDVWAEGRGVLVKAIEDIALGMASVYRTLGVSLPEKLPPARNRTLTRFAELLAATMPFDLVIDQMQANGRRTRVSRGSVCNRWGAVAGEIRYFAIKDGSTRAAIEGTNIPRKLLSEYAKDEESVVEYVTRGRTPQLVSTLVRRYCGFEMDFHRTPLPEPFPHELHSSVAAALAKALLDGSTTHPDQRHVSKCVRTIGDYRRKSIDPVAASEAELCNLLADQLDGVADFSSFFERRIRLRVSDVVPKQIRQAVDALPDFVVIGGSSVKIEYQRDEGVPVATMLLRDRQARQITVADLPELDRPIHFMVLRGSARPVRAKSLKGLARELEKAQHPGAKARKKRPHGAHRGRRRH